MEDFNDLDNKGVMEMGYVDFISLVRETNRPPGGKRTIRRWIDIARIGEKNRVLEIGSNTGFTSLELARTAHCNVVGVDVNLNAVNQALFNLSQDVDWVKERVKFQQGDARKLNFDTNSFDVIVCGGALSFIVERDMALNEILRVLRPWGFICISPLYYHHLPPQLLKNKLNQLLGFHIPTWTENDWLVFLMKSGLEIYYRQQVRLKAQNIEKVDKFCRMLSEKSHLTLQPAIREAVYQKALTYYSVFNENHKYLGFLLAVLRKRQDVEEMELFEVSHEQYP